MPSPEAPAAGTRAPARVLHLIWALDLGGAERQVLEIVRRLDRGRFTPIVGCLIQKGRWGEALEREGVEVVDFAKRPGLDFALLARLARFLRERRIDVVHTHAFTAATWGRLAALLARTPVVVAHEHSAFSLESRQRRLVDRALAPVTDRWIAVSEALARDLVLGEGLPEGRMVVIRNGIFLPRVALGHRSEDVRLALSREGCRRLVGTIGRLERRKGLEVFLDALPAVLGDRPEVDAVIVGEGPLQADLEAQARRLDLAGRVHFAGRREDVASILRTLDVFALPSHTEGLSISLLEATTTGCAVVATNVGGNPEVIRDGVTGLLVPAGDAEALTRALARLLDSPEEAARMGTRAAADVQARFDSQEMVRGIESVYEDLVWRRNGGPHASFKRARGHGGLRPRVRRAAARAAALLAPAPRTGGVRILMYHRVNDRHPGDRLTVHPLAFARQMEALRASGRPVLTLAETVRGLREQVAPPEGAVAITFDDGYRDNFEHAIGILEGFGLSATFFLVTGALGTPRCIDRYDGCCDGDAAMDWDEVRELMRRGHAVGGHGLDHRELGPLEAEALRHQVTACRDDLARETGRPPAYFCYPRGSESALARRVVAESGFEAACSVYPGPNPLGVDLFALRRTEVSGDDDLADFRMKLAGGFDAFHAYRQRGHTTVP